MKQALRSALLESLNMASNEQKRIIAWPTIGCGNLNYPRNVVAAAMFDEVRRFSAANPGSSLRCVSIVVYEEDSRTLEAFVSRFQSAKDAGGRSTKPTVARRKRKSRKAKACKCGTSVRELCENFLRAERLETP